MALSACGSGGGGAGGADLGGPPDLAPSSSIGERSFGAFESWSQPIEDFRDIASMNFPADFLGGIDDLAPFGGRLYIGYGDANNNLATFTPIEFRYFASPDDPRASAAVVQATGQGAPQDVPTRSGEEQLDRYRAFGGTLWMAGIDSNNADEGWTMENTEPRAIDGNVYRLEGEQWIKRRSIRGGEHVHDVALFQDKLFSLGSGADLRSEFEAGRVFRYLWRSDDRGDHFTTVTRLEVPQAGKGDTRWVHLLATTSRLWLFGYQSDFASGSTTVMNASYDGMAVENLALREPLRQVFGLGTLPLPDGSGLVYGVDVSKQPLKTVVYRVAGDGTSARLAVLAGHTVRDMIVTDDSNELLVLTQAGDDYLTDPPEMWNATVWAAPAAAPDSLRAVAHYQSDVAPTAIAFWRGALYLGTGDGQVLRAR